VRSPRIEVGQRIVREDAPSGKRALGFDDDEPAGIAVRQRPENDSVDDAEHCGVGTDAERERDDHGDRESRQKGMKP